MLNNKECSGVHKQAANAHEEAVKHHHKAAEFHGQNKVSDAKGSSKSAMDYCFEAVSGS